MYSVCTEEAVRPAARGRLSDQFGPASVRGAIRLALLVGSCLALSLLPARAEEAIIAPLGSDFRQAANEDPILGDIVWTNAIVQQNNSRYVEGVSVPQRILFVNIPPTVGNVHVLNLNHQANKGATIHAYDYLTSWDQAVAAANILEPPPPGLLADLSVDECGPGIGPQASTAVCNALSGGTNCITVALPDNMGTLLGDNIASSVANYELALGNRTMRICGTSTASAVTGASVTFDGYVGGTDQDATYTLSWTSDSPEVLIEVAGHLSVGPENAVGSGIGYGVGRGASAISGGPYHFRLTSLDGASLGSQDNQIKGADIRTPFCTADACLPGGKCDDGNACTGCVCDEAADACINDPASPGTACEFDGNLCSLDACDGTGACVTTGSVQCQAADPPCEGGEICNQLTGACESLADAPLSTSCQADSDLCTIDHCDGNGGCVTYDDVVCPAPTGPCDGGSTCEPSTGGCVPLPDPILGTSCERDGNLCTTDECNGSGACVTVGNVTCGGGATCEAGEQCDPATGQCVMLNDPPTGTPCEEDGDLCTIEQCDGNGACGVVDYVDCSALADQCNDAACDSATGNCVITPRAQGTTCERDGDLCTNDVCDGTGGCVYDGDVVCPGPTGACDGGQVCASQSGACVDLPDPSAGTTCDADNDLCTNDICDGSGSCVFMKDRICPGPTGPCDGGTMCNPTTGGCDQLPDPDSNTACEADGNLCTVDHCNGQGQCVQQSEIQCAAGNPPCDGGQECDPGTGGCVDVPDAPDGTPCEDGLYCNGTETCIAAVCTPGDPPCNDGAACTTDTCDEGTDTCDAVCDTPGITCPPNQTFECDGVGDFGTPTIDDTCSVDPLVECVEDVTPGKLPQERTILRTCTITNDCGNTASCEHTIVVEDTTPPVITCPPDLQFECDAIGDFLDPIVTDNCDNDPDVTIEVETIIGDCTPPTAAGVTVPPKLDITRTITATDGTATFNVATGNTGNVVQCTQHIQVFDTQPPTFPDCPSAVSGCLNEPLVFTPPVCTDTCGTCDVTCVRSDGQPLDAPVGSEGISISCSATDECLNVSALCVIAVDTAACSVPTVSEWGLVVLALLLLIGGKVFFGSRDALFA